MDKATISRAALGNVAGLGDLYDARTDTFCSMSIFTRKIPGAALTFRDNPDVNIHLQQEDTFTEKFSKFDVQAELQVSVLAGLFKLEGSGRYISDQKKSARSVKSSILYNIKTKDDFLNILHEDLKSAFSIDAIESDIATHVVTGISWGANSVITCQYDNHENQDVKEIGGDLSVAMKNLKLQISGNASIAFGERDSAKCEKFDIRIFGDVLPNTNDDLPTTFSGALNLMKQMPKLVGAANNGRGKPLTYRLIPLSFLQKYLSFAINCNAMVQSVQEQSLLRVVQVFDRLAATKQEIYDLYYDANSHKYCVNPKDLVKIISLKEQFDVEEASFRSKLGQTLSDVRSGRKEVVDLEALIGTFLKGEFSPDKASTQLANWTYITEKTKFGRTLIENGAVYIGYGSTLDDELLKHFDQKAMILYYKVGETKRWKESRQLFFQELMKGAGDFQSYVLDCDVHDNLWPAIGTTIQILHDGKVITEDLLSEQQASSGSPLATCSIDMERVLQKPNNRTQLIIPCTGKNCDPTVAYQWTCGKCKQRIEFGFDETFYCGCGKGPAGLYEFRCTDGKHGLGFERHDGDYLNQLLSRLRPFKELNILILGETGVGKSTWINGFVNFLTYDDLKSAEEQDLISLVPSEFTLYDDNFEEVTISTGKHKNEKIEPGHSATQYSMVHKFQIGDTTFRLIDTPGIGDTKGVDQDKKNFQNILSTLSYLDELHGICILLKPTSARLTVTFRFCIKELLTYLHRDACRNIVFCFTNSRGTMYQPGDTLPALRSLLKANKDVEIPIGRHTIYCYDSEAYRFLAAVKNKAHPFSFPEDERANFSKSWEKSIVETLRMLTHFSTLTPHPINSTLNLSHARDLVLQLTSPMAKISKIIAVNKDSIKDEIQEIKRMNLKRKGLQEKVTYKKLELEHIPIPHPKTVCSNTKCKRFYGPNKHVNYVTVCHSPCGLAGSVGAETIGDTGLLECTAISNGFCIRDNCGHSYRDHLHIYYDTMEVEKDVEDESVKALLSQNLSEVDTKKKLIESREQLVREYDDELKQIEKASANFACFLKRNAITPYNDAMLEYIDHLIREEKNDLGGGKWDRKDLERLIHMKSSYEIQISILENEIEKGKSATDDVLTPADVETTSKRLFALKHFGMQLKNPLDAVKATNINMKVYQENCVSLKQRKEKGFIRKGWEKVTGAVGSLF